MSAFQFGDSRAPLFFWDRVSVDPSGCWIWKGPKNEKGYGRFCTKELGRQRAHAFAYKRLVGEYSPDLRIDHLCRNRSCCNPAHLEPVTVAENNIRAAQAKWRERGGCCKHGHSPEFLRINNQGRFCCTACAKIQCAAYGKSRGKRTPSALRQPEAA